MNEFYRTQNIPTDFVYTGKMIYAVMDKIKSGYFEQGSNMVIIHTGGLQGNLSLPSGKLIYQ
jgi:1-aminocyclopropane-1-carboxylate deaminase